MEELRTSTEAGRERERERERERGEGDRIRESKYMWMSRWGGDVVGKTKNFN